jgi:hypothetical protein
MSFRHIRRVKAYLQSPAAAGVTAAERLVLLIIADGIYEDRETVGNHDGWSIEALVGVSRLRLVLERLARRGLEVRVVHGWDSAGKPMYAFRGKQVEYRLPASIGAPAEAPFVVDNGASTEAPKASTEAPKAARAAPSAATAAPYPDPPDFPDPPEGVEGEGSPTTDDPEHRRAVELVDQLQHRQGIGRLKPDSRRALVEAMQRARGRGVSWIAIRESADPSLDAPPVAPAPAAAAWRDPVDPLVDREKRAARAAEAAAAIRRRLN